MDFRVFILFSLEITEFGASKERLGEQGHRAFLWRCWPLGQGLVKDFRPGDAWGELADNHVAGRPRPFEGAPPKPTSSTASEIASPVSCRSCSHRVRGGRGIRGSHYRHIRRRRCH
jgi:hypothetical protein